MHICIFKLLNQETMKDDECRVVRYYTLYLYSFMSSLSTQPSKATDTGENKSAARVGWVEMSVDRRISARVKMKIYKMMVRPAVVDGLQNY